MDARHIIFIYFRKVLTATGNIDNVLKQLINILSNKKYYFSIRKRTFPPQIADRCNINVLATSFSPFHLSINSHCKHIQSVKK